MRHIHQSDATAAAMLVRRVVAQIRGDIGLNSGGSGRRQQ